MGNTRSVVSGDSSGMSTVDDGDCWKSGGIPATRYRSSKYESTAGLSSLVALGCVGGFEGFEALVGTCPSIVLEIQICLSSGKDC